MPSLQTIPLSAALILVSLSIAIGLTPTATHAAQQDEPFVSNITTSVTKKLYTYAGPLLPRDWLLISILDDRAVIGFNNGSARNAHLAELEPRDRTFVERLMNGTASSGPFTSAKEKLAQWSSSVTSTVSKFGKSFRDQFDSLINNANKTNGALNNGTIILN